MLYEIRHKQHVLLFSTYIPPTPVRHLSVVTRGRKGGSHHDLGSVGPERGVRAKRSTAVFEV